MTLHRGLSAAAVLAALLLLTPARADTKNDGKPPNGATVLFDGKHLKGWTTLKGEPAKWELGDGYMEVAPGKGDIMTKEKFGPDFKVHVEFWLPLMADKKDQDPRQQRRLSPGPLRNSGPRFVQERHLRQWLGRHPVWHHRSGQGRAAEGRQAARRVEHL